MLCYIFSTVWIPIFDKSKDWCYLSILFYFIMSVSVTCYSIVMDVEFIIKTTERYFVYFITPKLMFLASHSFHFVV